jgi:hypothetical protein
LGLALAGTGRAARAQDQSTDTSKDTIFARNILMVTITATWMRWSGARR